MCVGCVEGCQCVTLVTVSLGYMCRGLHVIIADRLTPCISRSVIIAQLSTWTTPEPPISFISSVQEIRGNRKYGERV